MRILVTGGVNLIGFCPIDLLMADGGDVICLDNFYTGTKQSQRLDKLQQVLKILKGKTIGLLGLTFKPDTDDIGK